MVTIYNQPISIQMVTFQKKIMHFFYTVLVKIQCSHILSPVPPLFSRLDQFCHFDSLHALLYLKNLVTIKNQTISIQMVNFQINILMHFMLFW